jgi:hypothetical protein
MTDTTTPRLGLPYLSAGQAQKEATHNEALAIADAAICAAVQAVGGDRPPAAPAVGQSWIVGAAPAGAWTGQAGAVAAWTSGGWRFVPPFEGLAVWSLADRLWFVRDGGAWRRGELRGDRVLIGGEQVVGPRLAAVSSPAGGAVVDAEARAAIAVIIARLSAHGLIRT